MVWNDPPDHGYSVKGMSELERSPLRKKSRVHDRRPFVEFGVLLGHASLKLNMELKQELALMTCLSESSALSQILKDAYEHALGTLVNVGVDSVVRILASGLQCFASEDQEFFKDFVARIEAQIRGSEIPRTLTDMSQSVFADLLSASESKLKSLLQSRITSLDRKSLIFLHHSFGHHISFRKILDQVDVLFSSRSFPLSVFPRDVWFNVLSFLDFPCLAASCFRTSRMMFRIACSHQYWSQFRTFRFGSKFLDREDIDAVLSRLPRVTRWRFGRHILEPIWYDLAHKMRKCISFSKIESLNFSTGPGRLSDLVLESLLSRARIPSLLELNFSTCKSITDSSLFVIASSCPNLKSLNLKLCVKITDMGIQTIARKCRNISNLTLRYCINISDASAYSLSQFCPALQTLSLRSCVQISDGGIEMLARNCNLKQVSLSKCFRLTDNALISLADNCPGLTYAHFSFCSAISDQGAIYLARQCHQLNDIDFSMCHLITDDSILAFGTNCPSLVHVCLKNCPAVSESVVNLLRTKCAPNARICFNVQAEDDSDDDQDDAP